MKPRKSDISHFMGKSADKTNNDRLYLLVVAGDSAAKEEMIISNLSLVPVKVQSYLLHFPQCEHLRDDLISQGFVAVVEAVNNMIGNEIDEPNPTGYISQCIQYALGDLMDQEATVRVPKRTYLEHKAAGHEIHRPEREATVGFEDVLEREARTDPRSMVDLRDELAGCCECRWDKSILRLREQGYSDADIAQQLGIPKTTAYMMRRGIYARFLERNQEYRGEA